MYHRLDKDGYYLGVSSDVSDEMEFFTDSPIVGDFVKFRCVNDVWIEGASEEEIAESKALLESAKEKDLKAQILRLENELANIKSSL